MCILVYNNGIAPLNSPLKNLVRHLTKLHGKESIHDNCTASCRVIEEKHKPIIDAFGTGAGLRLQRKDSDLALAIITELREQGIPALPIHDSFIVTIENKDNLMNAMIRKYRSMFRFYPVINNVL